LISEEITSHQRLERLQNIDSERLIVKIFQDNDLASLGLLVLARARSRLFAMSHGFSSKPFNLNILIAVNE
jgi:hypothetical protein